MLRKGGLHMGIVIAAASGKGGTGKTSFCANVGVALCALGEKVLLIDADAGLRSLDLVLGMTDRLLFSWADVMEGRASLKEAAVQHPVVKNMRVLTAPAQAAEQTALGGERTAELLRRAREHFTFALVDCSAGVGSDITDFCSLADRAVIVATGDQTSLRSAQRMAAELAAEGQEDIKIVVNRLRLNMIRRGDQTNIDRAMDASGIALLGAVPEDDRVIACGNRGELLIMHPCRARTAYMNIARRLRGERVQLLEGVKGRF